MIPNHSNTFDIIIIGGGPAGSAAAIYANKIGLKTIILDKSSFPRDKICGDALSGKSVRYMKELDLIDNVREQDCSIIKTITFGSPNHKQFNLHLENKSQTNTIKEGYVLKRKVFDNLLFQKAKEVTKTKENFKVTDIIFDNNSNIKGVCGLHNNDLRHIYAPLIFGCDGSQSIIAKKMGLYPKLQQKSAIAIRCYHKNVKNLTDQIELHFIDEVLPGYFWLFPCGKNIANIGIGLSKEQAKNDPRKLTEILDDVINSNFFRARFKDSEKLETPKGWSLPLGKTKRTNHGNGFMLLGDAAGLIDPFTGEGIGNAMASAKIATKIAKKCFEKNNFNKHLTKEYDKLLWAELGPELKTSTKLQRLAKYRLLLNIVMNKASSNEKIKEIISGMLAREIPKEMLTNPLFYLKVLFA